MTEWIAEPHTLAKIAILRKYLDAWFPIIGSRFRGQDIHYLDGFAGPGRYRGGEAGSPLIALESGRQAIANAADARRWIGGRIQCAFVEADPETFESLKDRLSESTTHPMVRYGLYAGELDSVLPRIRLDYPTAFKSAPLFAFLDPFGLKGLSWTTVESILRTPAAEVLLLFDADGVTRTTGALNKGYNLTSSKTLSTVFGGDEWKSGVVVDPTGKPDFDATTANFVQIYKAKVRSIVPHVFRFR